MPNFDIVLILKDAGCIIPDDHSRPITLTKEPAVFRRSLAKRIGCDPRYSTDDIFQSLQSCLEEEPALRQYLMPIVIEQSAIVSRNASESLIRNLLSVDRLQSTLITYLLERLPEFYDELEENTTSTSTVRMMLHQLRWLDYIVEPESLTNKLVEVMQVTPQSIQHEMITALPDIVNDSEHKGMVASLTTMMQNNQDLVASILDALSNFNLLPEDLDDIRETMLNQLDSANMGDLPVIMRFLLQTATVETIEEVIIKIRQKLDFKALAKLQSAQKDVINFKVANTPSDKGTVPEALVLESIKLGLQFHKFISDAWIKIINDKETPNGYKVIDVLVLFILYSMAPTKKKVEQILKRKIVTKVLSAALCKETILHHAEGINSLWTSILSLAESLLRSSPQQTSINTVSSVIYKSAFKMCNTYYRQEIVGILVTHIGSGTISFLKQDAFAEVDAALKTLLDLVKDDPKSIAPFVAFIKGVLDYLDKLAIDQIGALFDIFSSLALESHTDTSDDRNIFHLMNDMQIIIRKQLSNPQEKYKKIGIIGALSVVKAIGSAEFSRDAAAGSGSSEITSSQAVRHPTLQQAVAMLETVLRSCKGYSTCLALAYDELSYSVSQKVLDKRLELWIKENVVSGFPDSYLFDHDELSLYIDDRGGNHTLHPETWYNLDGEEAQITVQLFRLIDSPDESTDRQHTRHLYPAVALCPLFNLLQSCEKATSDGCLDEIDALLGCGILLFDEEQPIERRDVKSRESACNMLFYAINWLREVINAFCSNDDDTTVQKLVTRLNNVAESEKMLMRLIACTPSFVIQGYTLKPGVEEASSKDSGKQKSIIISSETNKRNESAGSDESDTESIRSIARPSKKSLKASATFEDIGALQPLMRELKIDTLRILSTGGNIGLADPLKLSGFNYLVTNLQSQLKKKLAPSVTNAFFGKKKKDPASMYVQPNISYMSRMSARSLIEEVLPHLPSLLDRWESILTEQSQDEDTTEVESQESISLILAVFYQLLTWSDLDDPANETVKKTLLSVLAIRSDSTMNRFQDLQKLTRNAFNYLYKFIMNMRKGETTVQLHKTLSAIVKFAPADASLTDRVQKAAVTILRKDWIDYKEMKKHIVYLVEQEIRMSGHALDIIHEYLTKTLIGFDSGDGDELDLHPLLRKDTLPLYYQALACEVVNAHSNFKENQESDDLAIIELSRIINCFELMTAYIKSKNDRALLSVILKSGRVFIEQTTKKTISYLSSHFKTHRDAVMNILKQFQSGTRTLQVQIICSHVKIIRDIQLSSYVPSLKKALEIVIYQAKALLTDNNVPANAFLLGALKHRDITGAEVSSQVPVESSDESDINQLGSDDDSDEEVPRPGTTSAPEPQVVRKQGQGKRVKPVVRAVPAIRSSTHVPTSDEESDVDNQSVVGSIRRAENVVPAPVETSSLPSPTLPAPSDDSEQRDNASQQKQPRKKRKLGTGLSKRSSHPALQSKYTNM